MVKIFNSNFHQCTESAFKNLDTTTKTAIKEAENSSGDKKLYEIPVFSNGETTYIFVMLPSKPDLLLCEDVSLRDAYDIAHHIEDDLHVKIDGNDAHAIFDPLLEGEKKKYRGFRGSISKLVSKIKNIFRKEHRFTSSLDLAKEFIDSHPAHEVGRFEGAFKTVKDTLSDEFTGFTQTMDYQKSIEFLRTKMGTNKAQALTSFLPSEFTLKFDPKTNQGVFLLRENIEIEMKDILIDDDASGSIHFSKTIPFQLHRDRIIFDSNALRIKGGEFASPIGKTCLKEIDFSGDAVEFIAELRLGPVKFKETAAEKRFQ